jgi:hypothetical protein
MKPTRGADAYTYYDYNRPEPRSRRRPILPAKAAPSARPPERVSAR